MKIAVSVPDDVFATAERFAKSRGMTRSELYSTALAAFLARHRDEETTRALNEIYGRQPAELDPVLVELQRRTLGDREW